MLYEIINPSDAVTFRAPDDKIARAVTLLVGNGQYGLRRIEDDGKTVDVPCMLLFLTGPLTARMLTEWFGSTFSDFVSTHRVEIAEALESCQNIAPDGREGYEALVAAQPKAKRAAFVKRYEDKHRSSMNTITKFAWAGAKEMRQYAKEKKP
jgi:hypothetical protein